MRASRSFGERRCARGRGAVADFDLSASLFASSIRGTSPLLEASLSSLLWVRNTSCIRVNSGREVIVVNRLACCTVGLRFRLAAFRHSTVPCDCLRDAKR
jgi:hypothetical protein